jgi:diacylglycerol kinase family enzyme
MGTQEASRHIRVIRNPHARLATALPRLDFAPHHDVVVDAWDIDDARTAAREAALAGERIAVVGGDGTIFNVVNAVADRGSGPAEIGLVPAGTANDLARDLGLPLHPWEAAWHLAHGRARAVDVLVANGHRCVVGGGFGLPALCVDAVRALRDRSPLSRALLSHGGGRVYQVAAPWHVIPKPPLVELTVRWTDPAGRAHAWDTSVIAGFFLNQATIGRGLLLAPDARRDDGVFELSFIRPSSSTKLLTGLWRVSVGREAPGQVVVLPATSARLSFATPQRVFLDGEFPWDTSAPSGSMERAAAEDGARVASVEVGIVGGAIRLIS